MSAGADTATGDADSRQGEETDASGPRRFIEANTKLIYPPLVPEVRLHLAEESIPIWQKTEEELGEMNVPPPYWAFAWAGGQALARYVLDHDEIVTGRNIVVVGSGSGLEAIAAARAGARHVLAADIDAYAGAAAELNAAANGVVIATTTDDILDGDPGSDVLLVGDLFYERPLAARVLAMIDRLHARGAAVLVGDPRRSYFPRERFTMLAEYAVPVTRELEDCELKRAAVWRPATPLGQLRP